MVVLATLLAYFYWDAAVAREARSRWTHGLAVQLVERSAKCFPERDGDLAPVVVVLAVTPLIVGGLAADRGQPLAPPSHTWWQSGRFRR